MKNHLRILVFTALCLSLVPARAQMGGAPGTPNFAGPMSKLLGQNQTFSATIEVQNSSGLGDSMTMPGKICFDNGKSRFELNMTNMESKQIPAEAIAQVKSMGLDQVIMIARPDKKMVYVVYPNAQSYIATELTGTDSTTNDYKMETSELGKDTVDGHPCVKNKVVLTDINGIKHESTVWNATDLKNFPVKIETIQSGADVTMSFKNISLAKPSASLLEAPSGYTKYDSMQTMMQQQLMKRLSNGTVEPGGIVPPPPK